MILQFSDTKEYLRNVFKDYCTKLKLRVNIFKANIYFLVAEDQIKIQLLRTKQTDRINCESKCDEILHGQSCSFISAKKVLSNMETKL